MEPLKKKGRAIVYLVGIALVLGAMALLRDCASGKSTFGIQRSEGDTIDVAIAYSPQICYTYDDTLGGLHYDMLREIASAHGMVLKFHPVMSLERSLALVDSDVVDLLVADVPMTAEYRERYNFLEPVTVDRQVLVQLRDTTTGVGRVRSALDLGGEKVWVASGSSVVSRIHALGREIGDTIYVMTEKEYGAEQLAIMTALGEIPLAVVSSKAASEMAKDYPQLDIVTEVSFNQFQSWIASGRRSWVADSITTWVRDYKKTPAYRNLLNRYSTLPAPSNAE